MKKLSKRSDIVSNTVTAFDICSSLCQCNSFCNSYCGGSLTAQSNVSSGLSRSMYSDVRAYAG